MRVIARRTLREFVECREGHKERAALKAAIDAWFDEVKRAELEDHRGREAPLRVGKRRIGGPDRLQHQGQ